MARHLSYDPDKVKELRMAVILDSLAIMNEDPKVEKWSQYKKDLILKMAPRVLPTLTEVSGAGGEPLAITFDKALEHEFTSTSTENSGEHE